MAEETAKREEIEAEEATEALAATVRKIADDARRKPLLYAEETEVPEGGE